MKNINIIAVGFILVLAGWGLRISAPNESLTQKPAGWIIAIGLIVVSLAFFNILKRNK